MTAMEARQELSHLVLMVSTGGMDYDVGKEKAVPLIEILNNCGQEIAKKRNKTFRPLNWAYALRLGI